MRRSCRGGLCWNREEVQLGGLAIGGWHQGRLCRYWRPTGPGGWRYGLCAQGCGWVCGWVAMGAKGTAWQAGTGDRLAIQQPATQVTVAASGVFKPLIEHGDMAGYPGTLRRNSRVTWE